jgi:transcriptional regulator with XRE-family HTH domain
MTAPVESTFPIRIAEIEKRRTMLGLSLNGLANKAIVSARTLQRIMAGERAALATIKKLADALGTTCPEMIEGSSPSEQQMTVVNSPQPGTLGKLITLIAPIPFDLVDETTDIPKLLRRLADIIDQQGPASLLTIKQGSFALDLLFATDADVRSLIAAFCRYELLELVITAIQLHFDIELPSIIRSFAPWAPITMEMMDDLKRQTIVARLAPDKIVVFLQDQAIGPTWTGRISVQGDERYLEHFYRSSWDRLTQSNSNTSA